MAFDGIVTKAIASELQLLKGARIDKIFQPNSNTVIIGMYLNGSNYALNICINPSNYRINLTTHQKSNPKVAPNFCMVLRKHLIGLRLKNVLKNYLETNGYTVEDFGTYTEDSCDYPDFAGKAAKAVANGTCDRGVVVCGTGIGVSITANKVKGIRCALCHDVYSAKMTRAHNDSNMLAMGQRVIGEGLALEILIAWLEGEYEGGRHDQRIAKMMAYEGEE